MKTIARYVASVMFLLPAVLLTGCSTSNNDDETPDGKKIYEKVPISLSAAQKGYVESSNSFALKLFKTVCAKEGSKESFLISPLSVTYALGMANNGASGDTRKEINTLLGFANADAKDINDFCHKLLVEAPNVDKGVQLHIANLVEVNKKFTLLPAFKQTVEQSYLARVENADFADAGTVKRINDWCNENTKGMIPNIIESIDPLNVAYLFNAIYFKASWTHMFDAKNTRDRVFTAGDGIEKKLPMMHQEGVFEYAKNDTYSTLSMPYGNEGYSMVVMLPAVGKSVTDVANAIDGKWNKVLGDLRYYNVDIEFPRFTTKYKITLNNALKALGAEGMFTARANFSALSNTDTHISSVFQRTMIEVNEEGSKAAAVTGLGFTSTGVGPGDIPHVVFHANRPFVYAITENTTGTIYFIGVYNGTE